MDRLETDVLVAGSGAGGLLAAIRAHLSGARVVLLGGSPGASDRMAGFSTALYQDPQDTPAALFNDMFVGGGFVNNPAMVAAMAARIGQETDFLIAMDLPFHRKEGALARRQAAGTTWTRAVFSLGMIGVDMGKEIICRLRGAGEPAVQVIDGGLLLDLDVADGEVRGGLAYLPKEGRWLEISARAVVLATGGAGRLYASTTNPPGSRGTGYALALEAGAPLADMEFISFEPFVMAAPAKVTSMELPTTVLREGAKLRNGRGEEFIETALAPSKDVICRAMLKEVGEGRGTPAGAVYFDLREMNPEVALQYSQIRRVLRVLRLAPTEALLEVMPAQHYLMGGVRTDETAATAVPGLYAVGEVSAGAHGAHRLATCGGTEAIAMGAIAGESAARHALALPRLAARNDAVPLTEVLHTGISAADADRLVNIASALSGGCGILRDGSGLTVAFDAVDAVRQELADEGRLKTYAGRATLVALAIAKAAQARTESRGDHFRTDYPERDDVHWLGNLIARQTTDRRDLALSYERAGIVGRAETPVPSL
ncbi:MAG: FAD-binding protein [Chloroflexota bacterium]